MLVVVTGATASGKTALSIALAKHFNTHILSADSRQFYREMQIGTAAPSEEERTVVPHHFTGHLSIHDPYNVSRFEQDALALLGELHQQHNPVIMTGGSGLYIDAVCKGIDILPDPDPLLRQELKEELAGNGIRSLREKLRITDPVYYNQVDLANPSRLIRALEVCIQTGKPYSMLRKNKPVQRGFRIVMIGLELPREELNRRINDRTDKMIADGLVEEARSLYPFRHLNALHTVGYRELFGYFEGTISLDRAITDIKTHSRRYAKRQLTWFRRNPGIQWMSPNDAGKIIEKIEKLVPGASDEDHS